MVRRAVLLLSLLSAGLGATERFAWSRIPQGAASSSLGQAYVARKGAESLGYTPAGLAGKRDAMEVQLSRASWLNDSHLEQLSAYGSLGEVSAFGFVFSQVWAEDVYRDAGGLEGGRFRDSGTTAGVAYNLKVGRTSVGLGGSYIQERLADTQTVGLGWDGGVQVDLGSGLRLGVALQDLGFASEIYEDRQSSQFPTLVRAGAAAEDLFGHLTLLGEYRQAPFATEQHGFGLGAELGARVAKAWVGARAGWDSTAAGLEGAWSGLSGGLGLKLDWLSVDFSYQPYGLFGQPVRMSMGVNYGGSPPRPKPKPREALPGPEEYEEPSGIVGAGPDERVIVEEPGSAPAGGEEEPDPAQDAMEEGARAEDGGYWRTARKAYERAALLAPSRKDVWKALERVYEQLGQYRKADRARQHWQDLEDEEKAPADKAPPPKKGADKGI